MKKTLFIFLLGVSVLAEANTQTIGVGAYYKNPVYHSKNQINALPIINLEYNRFYLKGYKPGFIFYKEPDFNFSVIVDPIGGYSDFAIRKSKFKDGYKNLDSRNTQVMGGFALDFKIDKNIVLKTILKTKRIIIRKNGASGCPVPFFIELKIAAINKKGKTKE